MGLQSFFKLTGLQSFFKLMGLHSTFKPMGLQSFFKRMCLQSTFKPTGLQSFFKPMGLQSTFKPMGLKFKNSPRPTHLLDLDFVVLLVGCLLVAVVMLVLSFLVAVLKAVADIPIKVCVCAHVIDDLIDPLGLDTGVVVCLALVCKKDACVLLGTGRFGGLLRWYVVCATDVCLAFIASLIPPFPLSPSTQTI